MIAWNGILLSFEMISDTLPAPLHPTWWNVTFSASRFQIVLTFNITAIFETPPTLASCIGYCPTVFILDQLQILRRYYCYYWLQAYKLCKLTYRNLATRVGQNPESSVIVRRSVYNSFRFKLGSRCIAILLLGYLSGMPGSRKSR